MGSAVDKTKTSVPFTLQYHTLQCQHSTPPSPPPGTPWATWPSCPSDKLPRDLHEDRHHRPMMRILLIRVSTCLRPIFSLLILRWRQMLTVSWSMSPSTLLSA